MAAPAAPSSSKVEKIVARLQERIAAGEYYEAQQQARVVAARHTKSRNYAAAVEILSSVAQALLRAGQGGSGGDLCVMLVDTYRLAETTPDAESKGRLLTCLRLFDSEEPTRKKFVTEMLSWSSKFGEFPAGDPELHHVAGSLYAEEHCPYDAERHLVLGTKDSAEVLAKMEYTWYKESDPHTAPLFAARAVLPYLLVGNLRGANACYRLFASSLSADKPELGVQDVSSSSGDVRVFPSLPLLNFLGFLLLAVQRGAPELFRGLVSKYATQINETESWTESLEVIGEMYFGITKPRQSNPLMDMMSGLFGGGAGGGAGSSQGLPKRQAPKQRVEAPAPEGLD